MKLTDSTRMRPGKRNRPADRQEGGAEKPQQTITVKVDSPPAIAANQGKAGFFWHPPR